MAAGYVAVVLAGAALVGSTSTSHRASAPISSVAPSVGVTGTSSAMASQSASGTRPGASATAGISGGVEGTTGPSAPPCAIAAGTAVAAAYGGTIARSSSATSGTGNVLCQFMMTKSNIGVGGVVFLTMNHAASASSFRDVKSSTSDAQPITGLADDAFYVAKTGVVQFIKGKTLVIVQATLKAPTGPQPNPARLKADSLSLAHSIANQL
jgi:hypothetical protein